MPHKFYKPLLLVGALMLVIVFFLAGLHRFVTLEVLQAHRDQLLAWYEQNQILFAATYTLAYILIAALSFPGATVFTLAGGAVFGVGLAVVLASIASTCGATLAFLSARYLFRKRLQQRYGEKLNLINRGFKNEGGFYLFSLRVIPVFPFFLVNLLMGLTPIPLATFVGVSQLGMLPGTIVYVYAGTQVNEIESARDVMSPRLWIAFALLGLLPVVSRKLLQLWKSRSAPLN